MNLQKPIKDPQIVTTSKRRDDEQGMLLDFEFRMGELLFEVSTRVSTNEGQCTPVAIVIQQSRYGDGLELREQARLRVTRSAEYMVVPIDLGILEVRAVAKVPVDDEDDAPVYVNFKLPPAGTSLVQTQDGNYPHKAANLG